MPLSTGQPTQQAQPVPAVRVCKQSHAKGVPLHSLGHAFDISVIHEERVRSLPSPCRR